MIGIHILNLLNYFTPQSPRKIRYERYESNVAVAAPSLRTLRETFLDTSLVTK